MTRPPRPPPPVLDQSLVQVLLGALLAETVVLTSARTIPRALTADNPSQRHRADSLAAVAPAGLDQLGKAVNLRRTHDPTSPAVVQGDEIRTAIGRISGLIGRMRDEEQRLLDERSATLQAETRTAHLAPWVLILLAITWVAGSNFLILRELRGGRIGVESEPGRGPTFFLTLPAISEA